MSLGEAAIVAGGLHGRGGLDRLAEGLDRNPRRGRDVFVGGAIGCRRLCLVVSHCDLRCVFDHLPISLILFLPYSSE